MSLKRWMVPVALLLTLASCGDADDGPVSPAPDDPNEDATALAPVIANGCNYDNACDKDSEDDGSLGGGADGSVAGGDLSGAAGGDSGDDGDGDASAEVDDGLDLDEEWDCHTHDSYANSTGDCDLRQPTTAERDRFNQLANEIRTDDPVCQQIHGMALVAGENLMVWDDRVQVFKDGSWGTLYGDATWDDVEKVPGMHLWAEGMNARTIAHEAMHHIQDPSRLPGTTWSHSADPPQEYYGRTMEEWGHYCT